MKPLIYNEHNWRVKVYTLALSVLPDRKIWRPEEL